MNVVILDDEPLAIDGLKMHLDKMDRVSSITTFTNALEAIPYLNRNEVDLLFIDIQMPDITGIELLKSINSKPLSIITTAYPQYALEGYELGVIDYVIKPVSLPRFVQAFQKALEMYDLMQQKAFQMENSDHQFAFIKSERQLIKLDFNEIKYVKGLKDYVIIYTIKEKLMTAVNLKTFLAQMPTDKFARINKSHIVNVNFISLVEGDSIYIDNECITLGKAFKNSFLEDYINKNVIKRSLK